MARSPKESAAAPPSAPPDRIELGAEIQDRMRGPFETAQDARETARLAAAELEVLTLRILREMKLSADHWSIALDPRDQRFRVFSLVPKSREG